MEETDTAARHSHQQLPAAKVKEEPRDDIKNYAETTMNELLGLYGYEKVSIEDTDQLNLGQFDREDRSSRAGRRVPLGTQPEGATKLPLLQQHLTAERAELADRSPASSHRQSPQHSDADDDTDDISSICSNPNETTLAAQHKNLVSALNSCHELVPDRECSSSAVCSWCQKTGSKLFTFKTSSGAKVFCSEVCFTQCRRASFKKNKICDWCKHVRHTVNYVDFQDGEVQLQFCSEKCLNQYKMNIFCKETQEHLKQIQSQIKCSKEAEETDYLSDEGKVNSQNLITPDLWLRKQSKRNRHNRSQAAESSATAAEGTVSSDGDCGDLEISQHSGSQKPTSNYIQSRRLSRCDDKRTKRRDSDSLKVRDVPKRAKSTDYPSLPRPSSHSSGKDPPKLTPPRPPCGPPPWFGPPFMGSVGVGQTGPFFPMGCPPGPMYFGSPTPNNSRMDGSKDGPNVSRTGQEENPGNFVPLPNASGVPFPFPWPGMPPMAPMCNPVGPLPGAPSFPPVTVMVPFPVVLPVPVPIPLPFPFSAEQIKTFFQKRRESESSCSTNEASHAKDNDAGQLNSDDKQSIKESFIGPRDASRSDSRASSVSAASVSSASISPQFHESPNQSSASASRLSGPRPGHDLIKAENSGGCPLISNDGAIDLSTDKSAKNAEASEQGNGIKEEASSPECSTESHAIGVPKIHIVNAKDEPPLSQELPLPKTNHPYNKRRGLILDAPCLPKKSRSPSPERRVYVRNSPRDMYEIQARRRCVRAKMRSK